MSEIVVTIVFDDEKLRAYAVACLEDRHGDGEPPEGHPSTPEDVMAELLEGWAMESALSADHGYSGVVKTTAEVKRGGG